MYDVLASFIYFRDRTELAASINANKRGERSVVGKVGREIRRPEKKRKIRV